MMSILPKESIAFWTSWSHIPDLVRSPANTAVSPLISAEACSATSPSRSLMRTWAPCSTSISAVARPIPRAEPVTIAALPSSTPITFASPCNWSGRRSYIGRARASAADDHAEVLRVDGAGLSMCERGGGGRGHADAGFPVVGVEDVGAVARRGHPCGHDRARRGQPAGSPGDVLADFIADARARDVASRAYARQWRPSTGPAAPEVFEIVVDGHAVGVPLGGLSKSPVGSQAGLAMGDAFAIDQATACRG